MLFSKLDWCKPGAWRCQLKTGWYCKRFWWGLCWKNLLQISKLRFGQKAKLLFRLWAQGLVKILKLMLGRDSEDEIWSRFVSEVVVWTQSSGPLCLWQCLYLPIWMPVNISLLLCIFNWYAYNCKAKYVCGYIYGSINPLVYVICNVYIHLYIFVRQCVGVPHTMRVYMLVNVFTQANCK